MRAGWATAEESQAGRTTIGNTQRPSGSALPGRQARPLRARVVSKTARADLARQRSDHTHSRPRPPELTRPTRATWLARRSRWRDGMVLSPRRERSRVSVTGLTRPRSGGGLARTQNEGGRGGQTGATEPEHPPHAVTGQRWRFFLSIPRTITARPRLPPGPEPSRTRQTSGPGGPPPAGRRSGRAHESDDGSSDSLTKERWISNNNPGRAGDGPGHF